MCCRHFHSHNFERCDGKSQFRTKWWTYILHGIPREKHWLVWSQTERVKWALFPIWLSWSSGALYSSQIGQKRGQAPGKEGLQSKRNSPSYFAFLPRDDAKIHSFFLKRQYYLLPDYFLSRILRKFSTFRIFYGKKVLLTMFYCPLLYV